MVKCLNDGPGGIATPLLVSAGFSISPIAPSALVPCPKKFKADYEVYDEWEDTAGGKKRKVVQMYCPVCNTVLPPMYTSQLKQLQKIESDAKEQMMIRKRRDADILIKYKMSQIPQDLPAKLRELEKERIIFDVQKKFFGEEHAKKYLESTKGKKTEKEKYEKETKGIIKGLKTPSVSFGEQVKKVLPSIYFSVGGLVLSALLGNPLFFFAALAFGVSFTIPSPDNLNLIRTEAKKIKQKYEDRIKNARKRKEPVEVVNSIIKEMEAEIQMETLLEKVYGKTKWKGGASGWALTRSILRALGFLLLMFSLAGNTIIPMAGFVALILGFIAYFTFTPERMPEKKEE